MSPTGRPLHPQGDAALARGDHAAAAAIFEIAVQRDERDGWAWYGLSQARSGQGRHSAAVEAVLKAHACRGSDAQLVFGIARRLRRFSEFQALHECLSSPAVLGPAPAPVWAEAAMMLLTTGEPERALRFTQAGLARHPRHAQLLYVAGNLAAFAGDSQRAEACYEDALSADPAATAASWMLAHLRRQDDADGSHLQRLERQAAMVRTGSAQEVFLRYAQHKSLHDLGRYDEAWEALAKGMQAKRALLKYDTSATEELFEAIREGFAGIRPASGRREISGAGGVPIFVLGMHRSGTTLVQRILCAHPDVADAGESYLFAEQLRQSVDIGVPGVLDTRTVRALAARGHLDGVAEGYGRGAGWLAKGRPRIAEKLPSNFQLLGYIARAIPGARFLHVRRPAAATCFSNLRTLFSDAAPYSYDQVEVADFFAEYSRLMAFWSEMLPGRIHEVDYPSLVRDPAGEVRRIAAFCGLEFHDGMLKLDRPGGHVVTASLADARGAIDPGRDRAVDAYSKHLAPMISRLDQHGLH